MGSRMPALLWWFDWHDRCVPGPWKSGGIPHLFRTSVPPYRQRLTGSSWQQQQHGMHLWYACAVWCHFRKWWCVKSPLCTLTAGTQLWSRTRTSTATHRRLGRRRGWSVHRCTSIYANFSTRISPRRPLNASSDRCANSTGTIPRFLFTTVIHRGP